MIIISITSYTHFTIQTKSFVEALKQFKNNQVGKTHIPKQVNLMINHYNGNT